MACSIYVITSSKTDKVYIGQTWNSLKKRFREHRGTTNGCLKLRNAMNKYGRDNFKIELIVTVDNQMTADYLEKFWIQTYDSVKNGYNILYGGKNSKGHKRSELSKNKMSKSAKNRVTNKTIIPLLNYIASGKHGMLGKSGLKGDDNPGKKYKNKTWKLINGKRVWLDKELI